MATVTLTVTNVCAGGGHGTLSVSGDVVDSFFVDADELLDPLTEADRRAAVKAIVRLGRIGRTKAQLRMLLTTTGLVVTTT